MYTTEQQERMRSIDITKADRSMLMDLEDITLDREASHEDRVRQFIGRIQNPYAYRVGNVAVKAVYANNGKALSEAVTSYLKTVKN